MTEEQLLGMFKTMIDKWNLYTVEKMQLEEDLLKIFNKHCLDKQRVKDAVMFGGNACNCTFCGECCLRRDIIKELGL